MPSRHPVNMESIAYEAMRTYGFAPHFPRSVIREVEALAGGGLPHGGKTGIVDLRGLLWSSIDNFDSEDLDQIEVCEAGKEDGAIRIRVAIADVDYYVPKGSAADRYAAHNGTSVYTGILTFPMLPDHLSKDISSLLPGGDRLAIVLDYTVLPDGSTQPGGVYRALVRNKAKLVYEVIGAWLEGETGVPESVAAVDGLEAQLRLSYEATQRLKERRARQGALALQTLEARPVVDAGIVRDLVVQEQTAAHCLIEEFMVAANETMVDYLTKAQVPMIQRIVRVPKYWDEIVAKAAEYGEYLPPRPDAKALAIFLLRRREADPERFPDLSLAVVKMMGYGEYVTLRPGRAPVGHFALAVTDYTHSTAPNRRYVDLIIQRIIKAVLAGEEVPYALWELDEHAEWLTDRDLTAKKVERFVHKAAAAVLLQDRIGEEFTGLVTGASEKGTYVRLTGMPAEGRVMEGGEGLHVGQRVKVRLIATDPEKAWIDFAFVERVKEEGER
ncbi:ribonuclease II [Methanomicrobiaceae archaeon CYW5]|uniref:RNB domain-containing ribonuclease n=1 Tax=Methanovulcanius yangii TaxID=1789227 RepID=UPI0029CAA71C|nr:RNB domain-containing ribonuclease [Methanovulcanius yangii]MBT8508681.1 ribonuclease II [Methanovulcanius yangii]